MRKRFVFLMAATVCLALAFTPLMADRADRTADRTRTSERGTTHDAHVTSDVIPTRPLQIRSFDNTTANRAEGLLSAAARAENPDEAISALQQALNMGLEDEKALAEAYTMLGDLYEGAASKQLHMYGMAMQYAGDPGARAYLQRRINDLGGDVFNFAMNSGSNNTASTKTIGFADTCDAAVPLALPAVVAGLNIENFLGTDHDWFSFDVPGPDGWAVLIETTSSGAPWSDDTDLTLWAACDGGVPGGQLAFNDDGGAYFLSLIETDCLAPGTYYIEVGGFFNISSPDDFELNVEVTDVCILPSPDSYEPDDDKATANSIGFATSVPLHANGWGRAKTEIQDHSIFPPFDQDNMKLKLNRSELVRMETAFTFPTKFNGFTYEPIGTDADSYIELYYGDEPDYGGFCNDLATGFSPFCRSDSDCPPPIDPHPAFPPGACIPIYFFSFGGSLIFFPETPLAFNEDISFFGDWGSRLVTCLPRADQQTPSLTASGDWIIRTLSSPVWAPSGVFFYQVQVKNEVQCNFETEFNGAFSLANPINLNETWHGFSEYSEFFGPGGSASWFNTDNDLFSFDVDTDSLMIFATDGYDSYLCDTALELYVGPDDDGLYYYTGISDDDAGPGWLSLMGVIAPPASDLLGNTVADADYFINVTSYWLNSNFPYVLLTSGEPYVPPVEEVEPNDTCATGNAVEPGDNILADINPTCDYDSFTFTLAEAAYVTLETVRDFGDTTMALETAGGDFLACDDDGGVSLRSLIEGCLPAGDYCARVRAYSGFSTIDDYTFEFDAVPGCMPTDPPSLIYDGRYRCDGVGYPGGPEEEFNTCPN